MHVFDGLGLRPIINADARLTVLGGSRMPHEVRRAMDQAAEWYVDMHALQRVVGERLAALTRNEAALVTAGAAAGLVLAVLACRNRGHLPTIARQISGPMCDDAGGPDQVVIHRAHRIPYDPAVRLAGAQLVEIGNVLQTFEWELEAALGPRTAAVLHVAGAHLARGALPLETVVGIASAHGVPVIVDAAAQLPPAANLWRFTGAGAALAVFSGGKDLEGPQSSGLLLGRRDLIEACRVNAPPHQRLARAMKIGREEIVGLLAAVERYVGLDHDARIAAWEATVARWVEALDAVPGVQATRSFPNEAGQPHPRALVTLDPSRWTGLGLRGALWDGDPCIAVAVEGDAAISLSPDPLAPGEADVVLRRLLDLLTTAVEVPRVGNPS
jgi:D-glucosaminate-6-phosphate ammonia-lyase